MEFSFVLPRNNKELLEDGDCTHYYVKQLYNANEIQTQLRGMYSLGFIHFQARIAIKTHVKTIHFVIF